VKPQSSLDAAARMLTLCLGFCAASSSLSAEEADPTATLAAIHMIENPRNLTRPGPCGELGAYQFRATTWRAYTDEPFTRALDRQLSDEVARRHFEWLRQRLEAAHVPVTSYNIALAWNGGVQAAISGRAPRAARWYAERAANLAADFARSTARPVVLADAK
jgi:hypothetical protein